MPRSASKMGATYPHSTMRASGITWIALAAVGLAAFFWIGLASLLDAWSRAEYSHGYLIPPIALYLFLTALGDFDTREGGHCPRLLGISAVFFGLLVGLLGNLSGIPDVVTYGLIVCVGGLVLLAAATNIRKSWRLLVPVAYLVFMLPLPNFLYWPLSIKLQLISSQIGVAVISFFGVPVYLDGNIIDLGAYQLQVAEACSGLRYLFPLMSFGFLFAVLYKGPLWHKLVLFVSVLPITVLINSVRIGLVGLLVDRYGIEQAEGFLHAFEGWVIFVICLAVLYFAAFLLQHLTRNSRPIHRMMDIDVAVLANRFGRLRTFQPPRAFVAAVMAIVIAGTAWQLAPARVSVAPERTPLILFPSEFGDWRGQQQRLDTNLERVLGADDYLISDYQAADAVPVNLLIAYYDTQTENSGIHSPEVCLPAGGWEVQKWTKFKTDVQTATGQSLTVNRAVIQKGMEQQLVYYWFEQRGHSLTSDYAAKALTVVDSVARGRTDGALVRVTTPMNLSASPEDADARLADFLRSTFPALQTYLPH